MEIYYIGLYLLWVPRWLSGKESTRNAGDANSILGWEDPLKKEVATHSSSSSSSSSSSQHSCLEYSMEGEPDGLQTMGSKRAGHD